MIKRIIIFILSFAALASPVYAQHGKSVLSDYTQQMRNHSYFALKTNILYDAVLIPNIGLELNLYKNLTIYGDLMYSNWKMPDRYVCWNLYGAQAGIRKYFGSAAAERSFTGHHAGIYCQALAYDIQAGHIGQMTPTINVGAGLEYGYSFPITPGFNIDLDLGMGFLTGTYYEYDVKDGHNTWRGTINRNWFGPTKASVSLVWLIKSNRKLKNDETM